MAPAGCQDVVGLVPTALVPTVLLQQEAPPGWGGREPVLQNSRALGLGDLASCHPLAWQCPDSDLHATM